jgi:hypothetical protein
MCAHALFEQLTDRCVVEHGQPASHDQSIDTNVDCKRSSLGNGAVYTEKIARLTAPPHLGLARNVRLFICARHSMQASEHSLPAAYACSARAKCLNSAAALQSGLLCLGSAASTSG